MDVRSRAQAVSEREGRGLHVRRVHRRDCASCSRAAAGEGAAAAAAAATGGTAAGAVAGPGRASRAAAAAPADIELPLVKGEIGE